MRSCSKSFTSPPEMWACLTFTIGFFFAIHFMTNIKTHFHTKNALKCFHMAQRFGSCHYLNQCCLIISEVLWHSSKDNFTGNSQEICPWYEFENHQFKITVASHRSQWVNSSPPSSAYMRQWIGSALVQIMACCLFAAKPLPEPMLTYCQLDQ